MNKRSFIILGLVLAAVLTKANAVEFRLINFDGSDSTLKYAEKGKVITVSASENGLSEPYQFTGSGPLVLFKEVIREEKVVRETAATVSLPAAATHAIVIIAATDSSLKTYAAVLVDDSPESRPAETIRFVNLTSYTTAFKFAGTEFSIASGGNHQVRFDPALQRIILRGAANVNGSWTLISGNPVPVRAGLRILILMRNGRAVIGDATSAVDMLSFYDRPPPIPGSPVASNQ
jgi:hypothetical protein